MDFITVPTLTGRVLFVLVLLSRHRRRIVHINIADMIGTTIETSIRIMSRWGKRDIVRTEKDGFVVIDRTALEAVALSWRPL